jgi:hypothetical protein
LHTFGSAITFAGIVVLPEKPVIFNPHRQGNTTSDELDEQVVCQ